MKDAVNESEERPSLSQSLTISSTYSLEARSYSPHWM